MESPPSLPVAPMGSLYAMQLEKVRALLASVAVHKPFTATTKRVQHAAWRRVHDDVWQHANEAFKVQDKFARLMAPDKCKLMQRGWDADMLERHAQLVQEYKRAKQATATSNHANAPQATSESGDDGQGVRPALDETADSDSDSDSDSNGDGEIALAEEANERTVNDVLAEDDFARASDDEERIDSPCKPPRRCQDSGAGRSHTTTEVEQSQESMDVDALQDLTLARAIVQIEPHKRGYKADWLQVSKAVYKQQYRRLATADALQSQFRQLLKRLSDATNTGGSADKKICGLLEPYCQKLTRRTVAMEQFLRVIKADFPQPSSPYIGRTLQSPLSVGAPRHSKRAKGQPKKARRVCASVTPSPSTRRRASAQSVAAASTTAATSVSEPTLPALSACEAPPVVAFPRAHAINAFMARDDHIHTEFVMLREEFAHLANFRQRCEDAQPLTKFFSMG